MCPVRVRVGRGAFSSLGREERGKNTCLEVGLSTTGRLVGHHSTLFRSVFRLFPPHQRIVDTI